MKHAVPALILLALGGTSLPAQKLSPAERQREQTLRRYPIDLPTPPYSYARRASGRRDNTPRDNPTTDAGATLGRVLFYDKRLSRNERISCASCHRQKHGFSDPRRRSVGFAGGRTRRNSMGLANSAFHPSGRFFWDERAATLEDQVLMPIQDKLEMGMTLPQVIARLAADPRYGELMREAFGDAEITRARIARALAQFVRSIVSHRTKFDDGMRRAGSIDAEFHNFTKQENLGKALFLGPANCARCHMANGRGPGGFRDGFEPRRRRGGSSNQATPSALFVTPQASNNGLDGKLEVRDKGIGEVTGRRSDYGKFKVPSLRNIALTAPYMHDGRLATLRAVVDHYERGVKDHPNLDRRVRRGRRGGTLSVKDKRALIAFLKTLTDHELAKDPRFSDPFRKAR